MSSLAIGLIVGAILLALTEIATKVSSETVNRENTKENISSPSKPEGKKYGIYVTEGGDTLEKIAEKIYDCRECWLAIYRINRGKVKKNPWKKLRSGIELRYPEKLSEEEKESLRREYMAWLKKISTMKVITED